MPKVSKAEAAIRKRLDDVQSNIGSGKSWLAKLEAEKQYLENLLKEIDPDFREVEL